MGAASSHRRVAALMLAATAVLPALSGCLISTGDAGPASRPGSAASAASAPGASDPAKAVATTASGEPGDPAAAVRAENARPGRPDWRISSAAGHRSGLAAYADRVSVRPGEAVGLYVDRVDGAGPVAVRALRIGWYGGAGAREVWSGSLAAQAQPSPQGITRASVAGSGGLRDAGLVVAPWRRSLTVDTTGWPPGDYLLRLDAGSGAGPVARYVPLTVRSPDARGRVLLVAGAMTWQAYNSWGGGSLYDGDGEAVRGRSLAVSFDRPYLDGFGSGRFLTYDAPLVQLAERHDLPLAWATDYDLATHPDLLTGAAAVVIGGHAEYWTGPMREAVEQVVAQGTNLAVFGANTAYWRVRLAGVEDALPGAPDRRDGRPRVIVGTKGAAADPLAAGDPGGATARFRDPPAPRPEERLTGQRYDCFPAETSWTVADPQWWGYAGTGVRAGEELAGVVGPEADRVYPGPDLPHPMQVVAHQGYPCGRGRTAHTAVYWTAPSGAGVFAAGTMRWVCALEVGCTHVPGTRASAVLSAVTVTVLTAFAQPRAGQRHPARDSVGSYPLPSRSTTGAS